MRNRKTGYSPLVEQTTQRLYDAYKSNTGKIVKGALEGALGSTISAMSSVADDEMLGIHAALGGIWVALTAGSFVEAGNQYINKREEDIANVGLEALTYTNLRSRNFQGSENDFIKIVNDELTDVISESLKKNNAPTLAESELEKISKAMTSRVDFERLVEERSSMLGGTALAVAAGVGAAAVVGGVGAMVAAGSSKAVFDAGIAVAGVGAFVTSTAGGLLNAAATNSKTISGEISKRLELLNDELGKTLGVDVDDIRSRIRSEQQKESPSTSIKSREEAQKFSGNSVELV